MMSEQNSQDAIYNNVKVPRSGVPNASHAPRTLAVVGSRRAAVTLRDLHIGDRSISGEQEYHGATPRTIPYIRRPYLTNGSSPPCNNMSHARAGQANGTSNHLNGDGRLRRVEYDTTPEASADERSQSRGPAGYGGYGGYGGLGSHPAGQVRGVARIERQHAQRRSRGEYDWSASRSRSRPAGVRYGAAGTQIEGQSSRNVHLLATCS